MTVYFQSNTKYPVYLRINDAPAVLISPFTTIPVILKDANAKKISVYRGGESYFSKGNYHLLLETIYFLPQICDNQTFYITREKIQSGFNVFYDRLFLTAENTVLVEDTYKIIGEEDIKRRFSRSRYIEFFLLNPIFDIFVVCLPLSLLGVGLSFIWGWKFALIFFVTLYALLIGIQFITEKMGDFIGKKVFHVKNDKKEFYMYFDPVFIKGYYADQNRTPYAGKAEIN